MGSLKSICLLMLSWAVKPIEKLVGPFPTKLEQSKDPRISHGPRAVGRNVEGGIHPLDIVFTNHGDRYVPHVVDEVLPDGQLRTRSLENNERITLDRSDISKIAQMDTLSRYPDGQIPAHFEYNALIQLDYYDEHGGVHTLTGNYMGFNKEGGYYRFLDQHGEKIGVFSSEIIPGSIKKVGDTRDGRTMQVYHDAPSGMFQIVTSKDPLLAEQVKSWKKIFNANGVSTDVSPTSRYQHLEKIESVWREKIVGGLEDKVKGEKYGDNKMKLFQHFEELDREYGYQAREGVAMLGAINQKKYAVCLDLSLSLHYMLAEMGYPSSVVTGVVPGDRHAWVEVYDRQGRVIAVIDSNFTKSIHPNMEEYRRAVLAADKYSNPRDVIVQHRQVIRQEADIEWQKLP